MTSRTALLAVLVLLGTGLVVAVALTTPWRTLPVSAAGAASADPMQDFSAAEIAREDAFHAAVRPPSYLSLGVGLLLAAVLGLTPLGARFVRAVAEPLGAGWAWQLLLGTVALTLVGRVVALPFDARAEVVLRRYGLSTQTWRSWAVDQGKAYAVGLVLTLVMLFVVVGLARRWPDWWWSVGAVLAAVLVVAVSFAYPLVVEPVFNKFSSMREGELRTSLLSLASRDDVPARDVLVADASRRTTSLNAYVSGLGATRRIVVYDTLLEKASPDEVRLVVAHELGHAKSRDVLWGTLIGALGAGFVVCLLALVLRWPWLLARASVGGAGDGRAVALVLAVVSLVAFASGPAQSLVSRRIEARADVHALALTRSAVSFASMQRRLAVTNLSDVDPPPLVFGLFASHPTAPQRIALARTWARLNGEPTPPPLAR